MPQEPQPQNRPSDETTLLAWLGFRDPFDFTLARPLGALLGSLLALTVPLLFIGALFAAGAVLFHSIHLALSGSTEGLNLGAGALIAALLGAPFVIWGTVLKHQSLRYQKEGHITDRISKAVEQLGAEKKVDRIGRPVTIWFGEADRFSCAEAMAERYLTRPRTTKTNREWGNNWNHETDEAEEGYRVTITTFPKERTIIQWQDDTVPLSAGEVIGSEGEWKVFSESLPNIEVRIGAILSLERIAQDSTKHDKGRDHVRVMEILCAYIRENAPAKGAEPGPYQVGIHRNNILDLPMLNSPMDWAYDLSPIRMDIQFALDVLGRRTNAQISVEKNFETHDSKGYRLDLSRSNLRRANLVGGKFQLALLQGTHLEGAVLDSANFAGSNMAHAQLIGSRGVSVIFKNANLDFCNFSNSKITTSNFEYADLRRTQFMESTLSGSTFALFRQYRGDLPDADFRDSILEGARIRGETMSLTFYQGLLDLRFLLSMVAFREAILGGTTKTAERLEKWWTFPLDTLPLTFGDASVTLADEADRPAHWPRWVLPDTGPHSYEAEYQKWLADPQGYAPPPPPA